MSLYNLSSGFQYEGRTLEDEARELAGEYESKIVRIAERLVKEFGLEHRLRAHMAASRSADRAQEVLKLVRGVKDLATEVAKVTLNEKESSAPLEVAGIVLAEGDAIVFVPKFKAANNAANFTLEGLTVRLKR